MDDLMARPVYPRHSLPGRRRKGIKEKSTLFKALKRQFIISIMVLLVAGAVKTIDSPITYYITERIRHSLVQEMDFKGIYDKVIGFIGGQENNEPIQSSNEDEDTDVPASADIYIPPEYETAKIDYGAPLEEAGEQVTDGSYDNEATLDDGSGNEAADNGSKVDDKEGNGGEKKDTGKNTAKSVTLAIPVSGVLGSPFGERLHPTKGVEKFHYGIDIKANSGVPIKAALDGEVVEAAYDVTYGKYLKLKHDNSLTTIYAHCSYVSVKKGQKVKKGQIIAKVGSTGDSTGPHLHFEVLQDGTPVNPSNYIKVPEK